MRTNLNHMFCQSERKKILPTSNKGRYFFDEVKTRCKINEVKEMRKRTSGTQSWRYEMKSTGVEKLRKGSNLKDSLKSVGERTVFH